MKNILITLTLILFSVLAFGQKTPHVNIGTKGFYFTHLNDTICTIDTSNFELSGNIIQWDDLTASSLSFAGGVNSPTVREVNSQGVFSACYNYQTANDISYVSLQMSHGYCDGTMVSPHIHYYVEAAGSAGDTVVLKITGNWTNIGDTINASNTTVETIKIPIAPLKANYIYIYDLPMLTGTGKTFSSQFLYTIERLQNNASDTYDNWFCILDFDIHYKVCHFGTNQEYSR